MSKSDIQLPENYASLLVEVKERVRAAQYRALTAVNKELVGLYWDIGRLIVERQAGESWGKAIVQQLAGDLQKEFHGVDGFSASNLWRMRAFVEAYSGSEKLAPLVREIGWSHNLIILERCSEPLERKFYIRMTRKFGWSKNVLIHQIENQSYEKTLLGQTNFDQILTPELRAQAKLAVKDEYTFDFLELGEEHSERELERALAHSRSMLVADHKILRLFEDTVSPLHQQMEMLKRQISALAKARDLLLPRLMNGEGRYE